MTANELLLRLFQTLEKHGCTHVRLVTYSNLLNRCVEQRLKFTHKGQEFECGITIPMVAIHLREPMERYLLELVHLASEALHEAEIDFVIEQPKLEDRSNRT